MNKFLLCPPRVYFPVLCKFWQLYSGVNGDLQQEDLYHTHIQSPWKRSVFIRIPKNAQSTTQLHLSHTLAKNNMWTVNFQMFKMVLEKAEEPEIKVPTSAGSSKKRESSRKTSALLTIPKPLTVWITINWKILKEMGIPDHWPASWETCMQVRKQQLELDMEQPTGSK